MDGNGNNQMDKSTSSPSSRPSTNQEAVAENNGPSLDLTADSQQQGSGVTAGRRGLGSGSPAGGVPIERPMIPRRITTGGLAMGGVPMERTQGCRGYAEHEYLSSVAGPAQQCSCGFTPRRASTGNMGMGGVSMERTQGCRGYSYHRQYTDCPCGRG